METLPPSRAAIIAPTSQDGPGFGELLAEMLTARRYEPYDTPLPRGYRPAEREWLAFDLRGTSDGRLGVLACEHVGLVFEVALWLAKRDATRGMVAWRHLRGGAPVVKIYGGGGPIYRVGPDDDRELGWRLPPRPPADRPSAHDLGLPGTPWAVLEAAGEVLAPYPRRGAPFQGTPLSFLRRDSPLA